MALDAAAPFEIDTPPVEKIPVEKIADLQPETVYALAIANMPQQKVNDFKLKAAQKIQRQQKEACIRPFQCLEAWAAVIITGQRK